MADLVARPFMDRKIEGLNPCLDKHFSTQKMTWAQ
jgi:hypothetical protein